VSAHSRWTPTKPAPGPVPASGPGAHPERNHARVLSVIAMASITAGAINLAAAATVGRSNAQNLAYTRTARPGRLAARASMKIRPTATPQTALQGSTWTRPALPAVTWQLAEAGHSKISSIHEVSTLRGEPREAWPLPAAERGRLLS